MQQDTFMLSEILYLIGGRKSNKSLKINIVIKICWMCKIGDHLAVGGHFLTGNKSVFHLSIVQHLSLRHTIAGELLMVGQMYFPNCAKIVQNFICSLPRRTLNMGNNRGWDRFSGKKRWFLSDSLDVSYVWSRFFLFCSSMAFVFRFVLSICKTDSNLSEE